jgi:hypothetical protein
MSVLRNGNVFHKNDKTELRKVASDVKVQTPKPGSKELLTKSKEYFVPGDMFGRRPRTARAQGSEPGYPGLHVYAGHVREEFIADLSGRRGVQVYEEMRKNDSIVGAMLLAAEQLIHNASVYVYPNKKNPKDQKSLEAAELVQTSLTDMGETWTDVLSEILTMLPFGWSYCAVWHKKREGYKRNKWKSSVHNDNKYGWAGISLRGQSTLRQWKTSKKGRVQGMIQQGPPTYESTLIPLSNAGHFRTKTEKDNPEGASILRNAWRAWYIKKDLEETEALGLGRDLTGVPVLTVPEGVDIWNSQDANASATLDRAEDMVSLSRLDQFHGMVLPFAWDFKVMNTPGQRAHNSDTVIQRWDQRIAVTLLADMLLIGHEAVGSYALADAKSRLFAASLESYAARISGVFNRDLIPRLMLLNGIPQEYWPYMEFGQVDTPDLKSFGDYLKTMFDVGINIDESIALYARAIGHMPMPAPGDKAVKSFEDELAEQRERMEMFQEFKPEPGQGGVADQDQAGQKPPSKNKEDNEPKPPKEAGGKAAAKKGLVVSKADPIAMYSIGDDKYVRKGW